MLEEPKTDVARGGITTLYNGTSYRSRLEARWACLFDVCGWDHTYEPFDGDGYIPDFLIQGVSPFLVEIKPAVTEAEYREPVDKIVRGIGSRWSHDVLILGAGVRMEDGSDAAGILVDFLNGPGDWHTSTARWVACPVCKAGGRPAYGLVVEYAAGHIRPCGHDSPKGGEPVTVDGVFRLAGNAVQWKPAA